MDQEPSYDSMHMVRMAIVERDDRLVILMPPDSSDQEMADFIDNYVALGWPGDRVLVMKGPEAFAVLKDEGQAGKEQPEGDQVDSAEADAEGSDPETDSGEDPQQEVQGDSHTIASTQRGECSHGIAWDGMGWDHYAMNHKIDHP